MQSPRKVVATVFCDVYCVLLIGFTPLGSTITVSAYWETKEIQGGCLAKETRILTKGVLLHDNAVLRSDTATMNLLTSWD